MFFGITVTLSLIGLLDGGRRRGGFCSGTTLLKYKNVKCGRSGEECPNTFKCIKRECCEYKGIPRCEPEMNSVTRAPWPCKGGGSKHCSSGYKCYETASNLYSMCCLDVTCVDLSGVSHKWYDKPWISNEDKCNKCSCLKNGEVKCTDKRGCKKCKTSNGMRKSPYSYWKDRCTRCTCKSKMYTSCTTACERGLKGDLTDYSACDLKGCGKQVAVQQCHSAVGADGNPCLGNTIAIRTCNEDKCTGCPGGRLTEKKPIIIGGKEVDPPHNFPWMVLIDSEGCGAALISPKHVLTAAHCVEAMPRITLKTGKHDKTRREASEQSRVVYSRNIIMHPDYDGLDSDIAIIIVDPPIELNNYTQPVLLPTDPVFTDRTLNGKRCQVTGWGRRAIDDWRGSSVLLEVFLKKETCRLNINDSKQVTNNMFCASKDGKDSCFGDSGGPFMCRDPKTNKWTQYGIVSWGPSDTCGVMSGVYTKVPHYIDWINDIISTDGGWGEWTPFTDCTNGAKSRARICTNPEPIGNGKCKGIGKVHKDKKTGLYVDIDAVEC
ncbi:unnamed protein product [Owenia fusiformis]|uniref:Peptidase S1 domain-containing protein n=1 Tax=Owenia fusiformis TaxID=6347 RepID=A0A8S4PKC9_OWEFU|nr:unnamed protein product [Owenia fusiformis]